MRSATRKRTGKDPKYLAWLHSQPCFCCEILRHFNFDEDIPPAFKDFNRIEAAHLGPRGLSQKTDDRMAIPLCTWHHREGVNSLHKLGRAFWKEWPFTIESATAAMQRRYRGEI